MCFRRKKIPEKKKGRALLHRGRGLKPLEKLKKERI
jgi:hypothetical protein